MLYSRPTTRKERRLKDMEKKASVVQVEIFGQTYSVRADGDPAYIQELAGFVDRKMREVSEYAPTVDSAKIAILAALNISDEFHQFRVKALEGDPGRFAVRANRLVEKLDEILRTSSRNPARAGSETLGTLRGA